MSNTVAIGKAALCACTNGDYNTVLGNNAMNGGSASNKNPSHNVAIGYDAYKNVDLNGDGNNTVIGDEAAGTLTTGTNNTIIGTGANPHAAGGIVAISEAAEMIRRGDALVALAGGVENPITPETLSFYEERDDLSVNNASPTKASRPLDLNRDGFVIAEGAAIVVLEDLEVAQVRGANILAELEGSSYVFSPGMSGIPKISTSQIAKSILSAVDKSGRIRSEIDVVYMNASGSLEEDALEAKGIQSVVGAATRHHMYTPALKGHTGNMFSASGPLGVIVLTEAMQRGKIPSTLNLVDDDPEIDLDANKISVKDDIISVCIVNAIGGPNNATLVISHPRVMRDF